MPSKYYPLPPVEDLRRIFDYDPKTGDLYWKHRNDASPQRNTRRAGRRAGSRDKRKYVRVHLNGHQIAASRVIWTLIHGRPPDGQIDHRNRVRSDNALDNLREATGSQNACNKLFRRRKHQLPRGVHKLPRGHYRALIRVRGRLIHLGCFDSEERANQAYVAAHKLWFREFSPY